MRHAPSHLRPERNLSAEPRAKLYTRSTLNAGGLFKGSPRALGLTRAVIVTGSANGTDNRITLDALQHMKGNFKGLALLDPAITDAELSKLKDGGFTGFRVKAEWQEAACHSKRPGEWIARTAGFGWHVEFMSQSMAEVIGAVPYLHSLKVPYVFDHVAHAEPHQNKNDREFGALLAILRNEEHSWINLYSFYQLSEAGSPDYADMIGVVREIIDAAPDRVIWGSNWPHAGCRRTDAQ